jgi:GntR family transcriptional regulator
MDIHIDSSSEVPIRRQLAEQVIFLIATDRLKGGELMPSVREVARRLKIHHNTVSEAYQDLVRRSWLARRRGSRLAVVSHEPARTAGSGATLDDLINTTIRVARASGYSMQVLRQRVRERLLAQPPDHVLVVEQDDGLRELIRAELAEALTWPVESCSRQQLAESPGLAIGALAVTPQHALAEVDVLFPRDRPVVPLGFSSADDHLRRIRSLPKPSIIAVVSGSGLFLEVARSLLAPAIGRRHQLREVLVPREKASVARAADLVLCDSIAKRQIKLPGAVHYRLLVKESVEYVETAMRS